MLLLLKLMLLLKQLLLLLLGMLLLLLLMMEAVAVEQLHLLLLLQRQLVVLRLLLLLLLQVKTVQVIGLIGTRKHWESSRIHADCRCLGGCFVVSRRAAFACVRTHKYYGGSPQKRERETPRRRRVPPRQAPFEK